MGLAAGVGIEWLSISAYYNKSITELLRSFGNENIEFSFLLFVS